MKFLSTVLAVEAAAAAAVEVVLEEVEDQEIVSITFTVVPLTYVDNI